VKRFGSSMAALNARAVMAPMRARSSFYAHRVLARRI
jgi:hypothetical protein